MLRTKTQFTAVYQKKGRHYIGFVEEVPGANTQGATLSETKENLKEALLLIISANRELSRKTLSNSVIREPILLPA